MARTFRRVPGRASLSAAAAVLLAGTVAALVVAGGPGSVAATADAESHTVTVAGLGQAGGTPDLLRLDLGVQRTGADVSSALNAANEDIRRIKAALARHGVSGADIQTSQLSISQHYGPIQPVEPNVAPAPMDKPMSEPPVASDSSANVSAPDAPMAYGGSTGSGGAASSAGVATATAAPAVAPDAPVPAPDVKDDPAVLGTREGMSSIPPDVAPKPGYDGPNGYDVWQSLTVKLRDLDDAGATISDAAEAGGDATRINGVNFELEDTDGLMSTAREKAFADAKAKAEQYADLAGRSLGRVVSVSEGASGGGPVPYPAMMRDSAASGGSVPIQPGSQQVSITTTVVWELN